MWKVIFGKFWKFRRGRGGGKFWGPSLENPEGRGCHTANPLRGGGGGMDIFWNHTIMIIIFFFPRTIRDWNSLPSGIHTTTNFSLFKDHCFSAVRNDWSLSFIYLFYYYLSYVFVYIHILYLLRNNYFIFYFYFYFIFILLLYFWYCNLFNLHMYIESVVN